jgi:hypothetical protein
VNLKTLAQELVSVPRGLNISGSALMMTETSGSVPVALARMPKECRRKMCLSGMQKTKVLTKRLCSK